MASPSMGRCLVLLASLAAAAAGSAPEPVVAVVAISAPDDLKGNFPGVFANFSAMPAGSEEMVLFVPAGNANGCAAYGKLPATLAGRPAAALVEAGNCTAENKTRHAQEAGLSGLVIRSEAAAPEYIGSDKADILVVGVAHSVGEKLAAAGGEVTASFSVYKAPFILDISEVMLICLATSLIVAGAYCSTADLRLGSPIAAPAEQVVEVSWYFPVGFFVAGSTMLVVLYFTMQYLIYVIIFFFCLGGVSCITEFGHLVLRYYFTALQKPVVNAVTVFGQKVGPIEWAHVIAGTPATANALLWLFLKDTSYGWLFQDIIGAGFLCMIQRTWRLPSMKLAAALLSICFFFDIFWVFVSPLFFKGSVMVVVATGGGTGQTVPMLLRMPAIGDALGRDRMVGFGDIALPGLLVAFLRRHDVLSQRKLRNGYFMPSVIGYFVALCITVVALFVMKMGQPALLYLVPGTLGTTLVLSWRRGELKDLWDGTPSGSPLLGRSHLGTCSYCPGGHLLQLAAAEKGRCDGCRKHVEDGERVMDCRTCNWYLCRDCRVQEDVPATAMVEAREPRLVAPAGP